MKGSFFSYCVHHSFVTLLLWLNEIEFAGTFGFLMLWNSFFENCAMVEKHDIFYPARLFRKSFGQELYINLRDFKIVSPKFYLNKISENLLQLQTA